MEDQGVIITPWLDLGLNLTYIVQYACSASCVTFSALQATGKEDDDIYLKVSSEHLNFPPTFPFSLIYLIAFLILYTNVVAVIFFAQICTFNNSY